MAVYYDDKKKSWYCKFRYTDWTGKSRSTTKRGFRTKKEAKLYEMDFKRTEAEMPEMTVSELCSRYLAAMKSRLSKSTYTDRAGDIGNYILPMLANVKLSAITKKTIMDWQDWLVRQKAWGKHTIAPSTALQKNRILVIILNHAVSMGYIQKNVASSVQHVGTRVKRTGFYEKADYDRFIAAGEGDTDYELYRLCYDIIFYSGMRIAEFRGLGRDSFDFAKNRIMLMHGMNEQGEKIGLKNQQSYRNISMPQEIMARIREYMDRMQEVPEYGMFPFSARLLRKHMMLWAKKAGLPYIMIHGLRHSHVSHLISMGVPITAISKRIGHKSPNVTLETYSHMYEADEGRIAEMLSNHMNVGQKLVNEKK